MPKFFSLLFLYFLISVTINLEAKFSLGVDYLEETKFDILKGKR